MANLVKSKRIGLITSISVCILAFLSYSFNGNNNENKQFFFWSPELELSKSDFMRTEPLFKLYSYSAEIAIRYSYEKDLNGVYKVTPVVDRYKSFMRAGHCSEALLSHEKYHANISSYIANKMNKILLDTILNSEGEFFNFLDYYKVKTKELSDKYDLETNHGRNFEMQKYWEHKIDSLLMN
jgi:hypothetical protein